MFFEFEMAHQDFDAVSAAQMLRELFAKIDRAVLATGATKGHHQVFEAAPLIVFDGRIDQAKHTGKELMHALLLMQIVYDRRVPARE